MNIRQLFYKIKKDYIIKNDKDRAAYIKRHKSQSPRMGENCEIAGSVSFGSEPYLITLGDNVKITFRCQFITHDGGLYVLRNNGYAPKSYKYAPINVGNNVFMGREVIIMPGVKIGNNCVVGARAVVTKDIPDNTVVAGVPARKICSVEEYFNKNKNEFIDTSDMSKEEKKIFLIKKYNLNNM